MNRWMGALGVGLAALTLTSRADAFCGFYVGGSGDKLYNNATHVVLMREGTRTVMSMANNYQGPPEGFALVVPVPVVLQKPQVKTLPNELFDRIDQLTAPRLVEYWEQDPCPKYEEVSMDNREGGTGTRAKGEEGSMGGPDRRPSVRVEATFDVNEYQIVILSADESSALETWLRDNEYAIPEGSAEALRPYIENGSKFFVAKVDASKVKLKDGMTMLSPLRFHYDSERFELPIRLGLLNAKDTQDLIVHIIARKNRFELANYQNVTVPTNVEVADGVRDDFAAFYATLFDATVERTPKAVVTEYAWDTSTCDPCPTPPLDDAALSMLGADDLPSTAARWGGRTSEDISVTFERIEPELLSESDWISATKPTLEGCYEQALAADPSARGTTEVTLTVDPAGEVQQAKLAGDALPDALGRCVENRLRARPFPQVAAQKPPPEVKMTIGFDTTDATPGKVPPSGFDRDYVVTRLHARYDRTTLGEDLVFRTAEPIVGGREIRRDNKLEHGATKDSVNNFQARYIIRHLWEGPVECSDPQFGMWGPSPLGGDAGITPARELAFAKRGAVDLHAVARTDVPELGIVAPPGAARRIVWPSSGWRDELTRERLPYLGLLFGLFAVAASALGARRWSSASAPLKKAESPTKPPSKDSSPKEPPSKKEPPTVGGSEERP